MALTPRGWLGSLPCVRSCPPPLAAAPGGTGRPLPPRPPARPPVRPAVLLPAGLPVRPASSAPAAAGPPLRPPARPRARSPARPPPARLVPPGCGLRVVVLPCAGFWLVLRLPSSSPWGLPLRSPPLLPVFLGVLLPSPRPRLLPPPCRSRLFPLSAWSLVFPLRRSVSFFLQLYLALAFHTTGRDAGPCIVCRR